jgi:antitoxin (DNA-binding transcriptional repressor) of toxin-antitoxin stability system|tara:strand:- start:84 stop:284 length:201 start_codon:yes stop_codon:yes gene_type:complete
MKIISLKYLEENFSEIVDRAQAGETFLLETPDGQIALVPDKNILKPVIDSGQARDIEFMWNHDDGA